MSVMVLQIFFFFFTSIGWVFDMTGTYDVSFYIIGSVITVSGAMMFPILLMRSCAKKRKYTFGADTTRQSRHVGCAVSRYTVEIYQVNLTH